MQYSYSLELSKNLKKNISQELRDVAKHLDQAVRFTLPDGGEIMKLDKKGTFKEMYQELIPIIKLPYDLMTIEYTLSMAGDKEPMPVVLLLNQHESDIMFEIFYKPIGHKLWVTQDCIYRISLDWSDFKLGMKSRTGGSVGSIANGLGRLAISAILNLIAALNCSNASIKDEVLKLKTPKNKKNKKAVEQPEIMYKVLILDVLKDDQEEVENTDSAKNGGSGTPKKMHLRRGHIRHLKGKTIWVNSCRVGDKTVGEVNKIYKVV